MISEYALTSARRSAYRLRYGTEAPLDIAAHYELLKMPIDICAGRGDGIIAKDNVRMHYDAMAAGGCHVTYKEFDFGHLDFTFAGTAALSPRLSTAVLALAPSNVSYWLCHVVQVLIMLTRGINRHLHEPSLAYAQRNHDLDMRFLEEQLKWKMCSAAVKDDLRFYLLSRLGTR